MLIRICRTAAATAACLLAAVGAVVLAAVAPVALVGVLALGAAVGVAVVTHLRTADPPVPPGLRRPRAVQCATAAVAVLLTMTGVAAVLGAAAGPVILLLLVGAAAQVWRHRATWQAFATRRAVPTAPQPTDTRGTADAPEPRSVARPVALGTLTLPALCLAWHRSYWLLRELPPGPAHAELTTTRERLLDELERRDPAGFRRWLHGGARASSDPRPYLTERPTETDRITPAP